MSNTSSKWLTGCGIGCGVMIIIGILIFVGGYFLVRDTVSDFKKVEDVTLELEKNYGKVEDFTPWSGGVIPADRIETFISVREGATASRLAMEQFILQIQNGVDEIEKSSSKFWRILGIVGKGFGAVPQLAEFYRIRSEVLLQNGMGLGEYLYIYMTAYYSFLGKSLDDGPDFKVLNEDHNWRESDREEDTQEEDSADVREERRVQIHHSIRDILIPMMERQLEALGKSGTAGSSAWVRTLTKEIARLKEDTGSIPWESGLPLVISRSLAPFRERLESTYSVIMNPMEVQSFGSGRWD